MKNMKISAKLIVSFLIITAFSAIIAVIGIYATFSINGNYTYLLEGPIDRQDYLKEMQFQFTMMRYRTANFAMEVNNPDIITDTLTPQFQSAYDTFYTNLKLYSDSTAKDTRRDAATIKNNSDSAEKLGQLIESFKAESDKTREIALSGDYDAATTSLRNAIPLANEINELFSSMITPAYDYVHEQSAQMDKTAFTMMIIQIVVPLICLIISLCFAFYIAGLIGRPVRFMRDILMRIGLKGDIQFSGEEYKTIEDYAKGKDEIGESVGMMLATVRRLTEVGAALGTISGNDLTTEIIPLSESDAMGLSLQKMTESLNHTFGEITISTAQVSTGSRQIADGAQALAQGTTQQAAAVQELSSSISEIAQKTKTNAEMAVRAADLANTIKGNAEKGNMQMDQMMEAVREINQASQNIGKVIKVIDDIAFQTNILALNAAVEAARAGQHGKGFAVVAEEVRNLAAKSADAAKDTGSLIANSIDKAELGARIAGETAASLTEIVTGINESSQIVGEIAKSSEEQSIGIGQINKGIEQVSQVVQQNSATAQQSAAASEQMSGQSDMLEQLVSQFRLKNSGANKWGLPPAPDTSDEQHYLP